MATKKPVLNNTPRPATQNTRPGSITVTVTDSGVTGGVLSGAFVSIYNYVVPQGSVGCIGFNADQWTPLGAAPLQVSHTDLEGHVRFERLPGFVAG